MAGRFQFDEWEEDRWDDEASDRPVACLVCEAMCPDAVDGTLSDAERKAFDKHVIGCTHCAEELEEAQRGAAWLGLLKSKAPEPPPTLLARILAETTGAAVEPLSLAASASLPAPMPGLDSEAAQIDPVISVPLPEALVKNAESMRSTPFLIKKGSSSATSPSHTAQVGASSGTDSQELGNVLPFRRKLQTVQMWIKERGVSALHPRLAMTAAMAFFSVALTLNLTGVRLADLRAANFRPAALQRTAANAEATAVRSFQNLRVVYQVESRVSELRQDPLWANSADADKKSAAPKGNDSSDSTADGQGRN